MAQATKESKTASNTPTEVAERYFGAVGRRDLSTMLGLWKRGGIGSLEGMDDLRAPEGIRQFFEEIFSAFPDFLLEVTQMIAEGDRVVVQWVATGTFAGPGDYQGLSPTGARIRLNGCDVTTIEDGKLVRNEVYMDTAELARQLGAMPPKGSRQEGRLLKAVNLRSRLASKVCSAPDEVAEGVWVIRGGIPSKGFNVYFVREGDGVAMFDAGISMMSNGLAASGAALGGIERIVLGHAHADHRGAAPGLAGVPVYCHPDEAEDARGDGGYHYFDISKVRGPARYIYPALLKSWDGGPVEIAGTISEGDRVGDFEVVHLPGHAPGLIGLWRESDRLALVSDTFYTANPERFRPGPLIVPHEAFNKDTAGARASMRKLAALDPQAAWPGHAEPITGDVREQLERVAAG